MNFGAQNMKGAEMECRVVVRLSKEITRGFQITTIPPEAPFSSIAVHKLSFQILAMRERWVSEEHFVSWINRMAGFS